MLCACVLMVRACVLMVRAVIANKGAQKWDKFVMDTVAGKTLGVVGFGHIGQTTARMAKEGFNMKIIALRNNPDRKSDLADVTYGHRNPP